MELVVVTVEDPAVVIKAESKLPCLNNSVEP